MWYSGFYNYEYLYILQKAEPEISKHSRMKIIQLLWTLVTHLLKNIEDGIEDDVDTA